MYMSTQPANLYVKHMCTQCLRRWEESIRLPGPGATYDCVTTGGWNPNLGSLQEQQVLLPLCHLSSSPDPNFCFIKLKVITISGRDFKVIHRKGISIHIFKNSNISFKLLLHRFTKLKYTYVEYCSEKAQSHNRALHILNHCSFHFLLPLYS